MRLVFTEPAARDLEGIIDYIALNSPAAAEKVYRAVIASTDRLLAFPESGRPGRLTGTREISLVPLPYVVVYQAETEAIVILAVFHGARDIAQALAERRNKAPEQP
jgi:toxin ParE1/3/4